MQHAHIATLLDAGLLSSEEHAQIGEALEDIAREYLDGDCPESDAEDLHTWVEVQVVDRAGQAGRKLHTARSRNDQVATLLKLYLVDRADRLDQSLGSVIESCCRRAQQWADLPAPMQTHTQFAAPGSMGFWMLRFAVGFDRVAEALRDARRRWQQYCPLGSGAVAGSSVPIDRRIQATMLGFQQPALNALDATGTRDECLELLACLAQLALHFQSLAADILAFGQTPFQWVKYPVAFGTGSSMMPNKANPDGMELLRGQSCAIQASYVELLLQLKGLPSGYNRDLQCCKPVVHRAVEETIRLTEMLSAFVDAIEFDAGRLEDALAMGHIGATLVMEKQVCDGMPLRDAHHHVADHLEETETVPSDINRYRTTGGAHPNETRRVADSLLERRRKQGDSM